MYSGAVSRWTAPCSGWPRQGRLGASVAGRKGFFWGERFKSVIVENGNTLINCLAYIDLNPVRAEIVKKPEDYRWNSLGYHVHTGNTDGFLSFDLGLRQFSKMTDKERLRKYREFVYNTGAMDAGKGAQIKNAVLEKEKKKGFRYNHFSIFIINAVHCCVYSDLKVESDHGCEIVNWFLRFHNRIKTFITR